MLNKKTGYTIIIIAIITILISYAFAYAGEPNDEQFEEPSKVQVPVIVDGVEYSPTEFESLFGQTVLHSTIGTDGVLRAFSTEEKLEQYLKSQGQTVDLDKPQENETSSTDVERKDSPPTEFEGASNQNTEILHSTVGQDGILHTFNTEEELEEYLRSQGKDIDFDKENLEEGEIHPIMGVDN